MSVTEYRQRKLVDVMEALDDYIDAKIDYAASRREHPDWCNPEPMSKATNKFQAALASILEVPQ